MLDNILQSMQAKETTDLFRPVRCLDSDIKKRSSTKGFLYFTTDTKKMYLGVANGEYEAMGGNSGVYYGNKTLTDSEQFGDSPFLSFIFSEIDGNNIPAVDDLILNIPNGGFYRVLKVTATDIQTRRLAMAGGGGGGGSTGGGGVNNEGTLEIKLNYPTTITDSAIVGRDYKIVFDIVAKDSAGDFIGNTGTITWWINGETQVTQTGVKNGTNEFDITKYLDPQKGENTFQAILSMNTGGASNTQVSKTWYITAINLGLEWKWTYSASSLIADPTFSLEWTPKGNVDCTTYINIYDDSGMLVRDATKFVTGVNTNKPTNIVLDSLPYGVYTCEMYVSAEIAGETHTTDTIRHEIAFISGGNTTLLIVPYYETLATQYDTISIPFQVYDPDTDTCEVKFYANDAEAGGDSYGKDLQYWPYTVTEYGALKLVIQTANQDASKEIELTVEKLNLDVSEVDGAAFSLKANNFSSNQQLREATLDGKPMAADRSNALLTFSNNFDWENGGLQFTTDASGNIEKYISVRQGTTMTVNYPLFAANSVYSSGKTFKCCFKAVNCYDYAAPVLSCYEEATKLGVKIDAQKAVFSTVSTPDFATQFCEGSYIELETEIWPDVVDTDDYKLGDRFLMLWIDGVPAGVKAYTQGAQVFTHNSPVGITVGSTECDVYIYVMKAYERKLTEDQHLDNFIMDAPNAGEMLARYARNDILDATGEISPEKLVQKNPNCHAYIYEMPSMTRNKKDKVTGCGYMELYGDYNTFANPWYKAKNSNTDWTTRHDPEVVEHGAQVYVQGTSSSAYGVAAFNLRTKFQEGFEDRKVGDETVKLGKKWKVSDGAIPVKLACTKVNVASCENANNVVNQEWYNKFQPYHDGHRRKTSAEGVFRDCMEFQSGVVFVKDHNQTVTYTNAEGKPTMEDYIKANVFLEDADYVKNPWYRQYAIGNMGNDKKNVEVFHDTTNPKACCVEVTDNQTAQQFMTTTVENNQSLWTGDSMPFEFRYPDGNYPDDGEEGTTEEMRQAWVDFVNWMASCDPCPYDAENHPMGWKNDPLLDADGQPTSVTYGSKKFSRFDPPGFEGTPSPTGVTLAGLEIEDFKGTYTHDNEQYRMAKFLDECEDHLVMDSVVFHYLFIQRHTMVDNVAKNCFWSSEDLIHWDLTKNYDNDTADGNDNSGYLKYSYGIEALEKDAGGTDIFNAPASVWLNAIHRLPAAQEKLFQELELKGAWKAEEYLKEFDKHQKVIPERCWIYDYFRKYIRPRRLGLDENTYLNRLEGGKKVHQRNQYETYQEFYMNSKYYAGDAFINATTSLDLRLNSDPSGVWNSENIIPVSYYIDCYPVANIGGKVHRGTQRIKRKEVHNIPVGTMVQSPKDATCYIQGAAMLQTIDGIAPVYPNYAKFNAAGKLRSVNMGSVEEGYYNPNLTGINIASNTMVETLKMQNVGQSEGADALDLKSLYQLSTLEMNGSKINGLTLANGGILQKLHLSAVPQLQMSNMSHLSDVAVDEGIYSSLISVSIKNCPKMDEFSYSFALRAPIQTYAFTDFNWTVSSADDLTVEGGIVTGIKAIDNLMTRQTFPGSTPAASLVGTITITAECKVNEYNLYTKYCQTYPNLIIKYGGSAEVTKAPTLTFMVSDLENAAEHYRVLAGPDMSIEALCSADGPTGAAITAPHRESTLDQTFTFTGYWKNGNTYYYFGDTNPGTETATAFSTVKPYVAGNDMVFLPVYDVAVRSYAVKFYDNDGVVIKQNGQDEYWVPYGSKYDGPLGNFHYREPLGLKPTERWGFKGWSTTKYRDNIIAADAKYVDVTNLTVTGTVILYGHYITEDCTTVASNAEYFISSGTTININPIYADKLVGKITFPSKDANGNYYKSVGEAKNMVNVTHVFFLKDCQITSINPYAFSCSEGGEGGQQCSFQAIYFPESLEHLGAYAFPGSNTQLKTVQFGSKLKTIGEWVFQGDTNLELKELPENLESLGIAAFLGCTKIAISKLPVTLKEIGSYSLSGCPDVGIEQFGGGTAQLTTIGPGALENSGGNCEHITQLVIDNPVNSIKTGAFAGYCGSFLSAVYFRHNPLTDLGTGEAYYGIEPTEMGFADAVHIDIIDNMGG